MAARAGKDASRPCSTCLYWRAGLAAVALALLVTWLVGTLAG
jgi:hypothetical protein